MTKKILSTPILVTAFLLFCIVIGMFLAKTFWQTETSADSKPKDYPYAATSLNNEAQRREITQEMDPDLQVKIKQINFQSNLARPQQNVAQIDLEFSNQTDKIFRLHNPQMYKLKEKTTGKEFIPIRENSPAEFGKTQELKQGALVDSVSFELAKDAKISDYTLLIQSGFLGKKELPLEQIPGQNTSQSNSLASAQTISQNLSESNLSSEKIEVQVRGLVQSGPENELTNLEKKELEAKAKEGSKFSLVAVEIDNKSVEIIKKEDLNVLFRLKDGEGNFYPIYTSLEGKNLSYNFPSDLAANRKQTFTLAFEIPQEAQKLELTYKIGQKEENFALYNKN